MIEWIMETTGHGGMGVIFVFIKVQIFGVGI